VEGTVEFWIRGVDIQRLKEDEDHYFVIVWDKTTKEVACYVDTKEVKVTKDFRVSDKRRNEAYIKATYLGLKDKLVRFGTEETKE